MGRRPLSGMALMMALAIGGADGEACENCGGQNKKSPTKAYTRSASDIWLYDNFYAPLTIRVPPGTTVRWINYALHRHTVTSEAGLWDSGPIAGGQSFSITFNEPGTFTYYCRFHSGMRGTVVVW